jgi:hypothetical protein
VQLEELKKETSDFGRVGLMEAKVLIINPTMEEYKDKLGMELKKIQKLQNILEKVEMVTRRYG